MKLRLGTRGSDLALAQSRDVAARLLQAGFATELVIIKTAGDKNQSTPFAEVGQAGIFVRELEGALLEERVDLAVHSYKDLPSQSPAALTIAAVPERESAADVLLLAPGVSSAAKGPQGELLPLPSGATVGTASARRQALVRHLRPDLKVGLLRGNVPTRLRRLADGDFDAILLAQAGLRRLDRALRGQQDYQRLRQPLQVVGLPLDRFVPAPAQGAVACQVREIDVAVKDAVANIHNPALAQDLEAERQVLAWMQAGCEVPLGVHCYAAETTSTPAQATSSELSMHAFLETAGKANWVTRSHRNAQQLAEEVWQQLQRGSA